MFGYILDFVVSIYTVILCRLHRIFCGLYYDDVIPPDTDRVKEGLDKELIKKIVALSVGVIFIISMCVVMLYVL